MGSTCLRSSLQDGKTTRRLCCEARAALGTQQRGAPGPISSTTSVLFTPALSTIDCTTSGFFRICWPLDLWNSMPVPSGMWTGGRQEGHHQQQSRGEGKRWQAAAAATQRWRTARKRAVQIAIELVLMCWQQRGARRRT